MADITSNDNERAFGRASGEPHGQAAMLVVESLLHNLIARKLIDVGDAVEVVGTAVEVATELEESPARPTSSLTILTSLQNSLSRDLG